MLYAVVVVPKSTARASKTGFGTLVKGCIVGRFNSKSAPSPAKLNPARACGQNRAFWGHGRRNGGPAGTRDHPAFGIISSPTAEWFRLHRFLASASQLWTPRESHWLAESSVWLVPEHHRYGDRLSGAQMRLSDDWIMLKLSSAGRSSPRQLGCGTGWKI